MAEEENNTQVTTKKTTGNPVVIILLAVNAVMMGAVGFFQFQMHSEMKKEAKIKDVVLSQMEDEREEKEASKEAGKAGEKAALIPKINKSAGQLFPMEGITTNLAPGDGPRRYVRLTIVLKFSPDSKEEEYKIRGPQIRDTVIGILNAKRADDLAKVEGKIYLKKEIITAINSFLIDGTLEDIFYIGFVIN